MRAACPRGAHRDERPCWRCERTLHKTEFPLGRSGRRRSAVCWRCTEEEAIAYDAHFSKWRATRIVDATTGAKVRRCAGCHEEKPLDDEHFYRRGSEAGYMALCKPCGAESARHYAKPRDTAKGRATRKRYLVRLKADPERHARYLEGRRIRHHLRREQKTGQALDATHRSSRAKMSRTAPSYLPSAPLAALVGRVIDQRTAVSEVLGDRERQTRNGVIGEVCDELGVTERTYRRWKVGDQPKVRIGVAEKVLLNAGVEWHEVYSYDDHAAQFLAEVPA